MKEEYLTKSASESAEVEPPAPSFTKDA